MTNVSLGTMFVVFLVTLVGTILYVVSAPPNHIANLPILIKALIFIICVISNVGLIVIFKDFLKRKIKESEKLE